MSRETFFKLNRIYLIISLLAGLVLPLDIFQVEEISHLPVVEVVKPIAISFEAVERSAINFQAAKTPTQNWSLSAIMVGLYFSISLFFLIKIIIDFLKIFRLVKTGEKQREGQFLIITTEGVETPFSFFNYIFINKKMIENADYQEIINHEKAHSIQKHSLDVVSLEILRGMFWLSPVIHFYARSLRNVHEYLADAAVLQYTGKKHYGQLLISQTAVINGLKIAHHFNFSQLKKRIIMMSRNPSQYAALVTYIIAAPIFLFLIFAFAKPNNP
ncbi:MAG TPA: M56 family metallopeptidase, partial [Allocoleopsis sp.]